MKKSLLWIFFLLLLFPVNTYGEDLLSIDDFDFRESEKILRQNGYEDIHVDTLLKALMKGDFNTVFTDGAALVKEKTVGDLIFVRRIMLNVLLIIIISAFFTNFANVFSKDNVSNMGFYVCYLLVISGIITIFETVCQVASGFIEVLLQFLTAMIPTYFVSIALLGQASAAGFYQVLVLAIGLVQFVFSAVLIPMIKIYLATGLVNNLSQEDFLSRLADLMKRFILFCNKFLVGAICGVNLIQAMILPSIDGIKNTAFQKIISAVPWLGNSAGSYVGILIGTSNLIKNVIGGFTMIVILLLCSIPCIKMEIYHIAFRLLSAVIQPVADERILSALQVVSDSIGFLLKLVLGSALLFIVCIGIICLTVKGG